MLIYLYSTLIFFLINNPDLSFVVTFFWGMNIGFPKLGLAFHANIVSCRRGGLLMHPKASTTRKRKLDPKKILSWAILIFHEHERRFQPLPRSSWWSQKGFQGTQIHQREWMPWSRLAKEENSVLINVSGGGTTLFGLFSIPKQAATVFHCLALKSGGKYLKTKSILII